MSDLFTQVEWVDEQVQFPARRELTNVSTQEKKTVVVERSEGNVYTEGTRFGADALNDLEERLTRAFNEIQELIKARVNLYYPVGKIYMSFNNTDPSQLFPGTTWQKLSGYVLMPSTGNAGQTGGRTSVSVTPQANSISASGSVGAHSLTVGEMPAHSHTFSTNYGYPYDFDYTKTSFYDAYVDGDNRGIDVNPDTSYAGNQGASHSHSFSNAKATFSGISKSINLSQKYISVYAWRRTT